MYQFDDHGALLATELPFPGRRGKVRDVYDLGDRLLIVSTDRISAFDHILPSGIPEKGRLLTRMSQFWFAQIDRLDLLPHHLLSTEVPEEVARQCDAGPLRERVMVTRKAEVVPFECVVRGYLEGSGWREYQAGGAVCEIELPTGLRQCDRLPSPLFTPATKAETGHDENVSFQIMAGRLGVDLAVRLRTASLDLYQAACEIASGRGIMIADTKFEFGHHDGELLLIDEVLTPDSSRFWDAADYQAGSPQRSFDKQFVREYLQSSDWDRVGPPPPLPPEIIQQTAARYAEAYRRLTGEEPVAC